MKDGDSVAKRLASAGFTLKRPHIYSEGFQKGLIVQSIKLKNGQYFQVVSPNPKESKRGDLALWYENQIQTGAIGAGLVLEDMPIPLNQIHAQFKKAKIKSQLKRFKRYSWLSFRADSPYSALSFIDQQYLPSDSQEVLTHENGAYSLGHIQVRPYGVPETWASILTLSGSTQARLKFDAPLFSGKGFITEVEIKSKKKPLPKPLKLDHILLKFVN